MADEQSGENEPVCLTLQDVLELYGLIVGATAVAPYVPRRRMSPQNVALTVLTRMNRRGRRGSDVAAVTLTLTGRRLNLARRRRPRLLSLTSTRRAPGPAIAEVVKVALPTTTIRRRGVLDAAATPITVLPLAESRSVAVRVAPPSHS